MLISDILRLDKTGIPVKVEGWVRSKRDSKETVFLSINDGTCVEGIQVVFEKGKMNSAEDLLKQVHTGCAVTVTGNLTASPGGRQHVEVQGSSLVIEGTADPESYPLQKKRHSLEFLREIAHLRSRTNTIQAVMRVRNELSMAIHTFFQERGFYYIHTPVITGVDAEGAGAMFQVTTLDMSNPLRDEAGEIDYRGDFFGQKAYLSVTGQLEAEVYALAMKNVYTFGPTFRAENSNTSRHLAEFWMVEPEMAFCDINGNMDVAEAFLKYTFERVLSRCHEDMAFFDQFIQKGILSAMEQVVHKEFTRMSYTEAIHHLKKAGGTFSYDAEWGLDLQSEHEKYLTEQIVQGPVIVTDYPKDIKAFYMKQNADGETVRAMDVLVPRLGEIIGGSEREERIDVLGARMKELGLRQEDYWWYMDLRRYGSVRHSGFGLGFERLIQYVTGMQNIRDVIPFPRCVKTVGF